MLVVPVQERSPGTGLKCPTESSPTAIDFTQAIWVCSANNGRNRTTSSNGIQGCVDDPATFRKNEPFGRNTRRNADATRTIQSR